jgi:hypothetical protein
MGEDVVVGKWPPRVVAGLEGLLDAASAGRESDWFGFDD